VVFATGMAILGQFGNRRCKLNNSTGSNSQLCGATSQSA